MWRAGEREGDQKWEWPIFRTCQRPGIGGNPRGSNGCNSYSPTGEIRIATHPKAFDSKCVLPTKYAGTKMEQRLQECPTITGPT